jgi:hypothetical protein
LREYFEESADLDRYNRNLKLDGHNTDSGKERLDGPILTSAALGKEKGAVSSLDKFTSVSQCFLDSSHLLRNREGIEDRTSKIVFERASKTSRQAEVPVAEMSCKILLPD